MPKEKLDLEDNLEELCSIDENDSHVPWDPILKNSEELEQALSRKRKAEVEKAILSYHQLEKRLKSDVLSEGHNEMNLNSIISINNNYNSFQSMNLCSKAALHIDTNGIFQSLQTLKSLET
jgi:hypothetical protein